jgi:hypothetical protein
MRSVQLAALIGACITAIALATQSIAQTTVQRVEGVGSNGNAVVGRPVLVAGSDGTNTVTIKSSSGGALMTGESVATVAESAGAKVTITNSATSVLSANASRKSFKICNVSTVRIFCGLSASVSTSAYADVLEAASGADRGDGQCVAYTGWGGVYSCITASGSGAVTKVALTNP